MAAAGYVPFKDPYDRPTYDDKFVPSFQVLVSEARRTGQPQVRPNVSSDQYDTLSKALRVKEGSDEAVTLIFDAFEEGASLSSVEYVNRSADLTNEIFQSRVTERYGELNGQTGTIHKKPAWDFGTVTVDGLQASELLTLEMRSGFPERTLVLRRAFAAGAYLGLIKQKADALITEPSETTF